MPTSAGPTVPVRDRILAAAADLARASGWRQVRMTAVAARAGVSRQTVYAQFETKDGLARGLVTVEVERVVGLAVAAMEGHPDGDPAGAIAAGVRAVLDEGRRNALLRVVLDRGPGGDPELIRLLTSDAAPVYVTLWNAVAPWVRRTFPAADLPTLAAVIDVLGRVTVSHLVQPGAGDLDVARTVSGMAVGYLRSHSAPA